jgi:hypothetical protein
MQSSREFSLLQAEQYWGGWPYLGHNRNHFGDGGTLLESYFSVTWSFETWSWMMEMWKLTFTNWWFTNWWLSFYVCLLIGENFGLVLQFSQILVIQFFFWQYSFLEKKFCWIFFFSKKLPRIKQNSKRSPCLYTLFKQVARI